MHRNCFKNFKDLISGDENRSYPRKQQKLRPSKICTQTLSLQLENVMDVR